jgi:hypothetical protein
LDKLFVAGQALKHIGDRRLIDVEFGNVPTNIFIRCVSEHLQLFGVSPQDCAIAGDKMQCHDSVFEQVLKGPGREMKLCRLVEAIDGPNDSSAFLFNRFDVSRRPKARPVRPLNQTFHPMDGDSALQHCQHRRLFRGDLPPLKRIRPTKALYVLVAARCAASQGNGSGIEPDDPALHVTTVNRHRKLFDEVGTHLKSGRGAGTLCYSAHFSISRFTCAHLALHSLLGRRSTANEGNYVLYC